MISGAFRVLFFAVLALAAGWGSIAISSPGGTTILVEEGERFQAAFPSERRGGSFPTTGPTRHPRPVFGFILPSLGDGSIMTNSASIIRIRVRVAADFLPIFSLVLAAGWLLGLVQRERIRFGLAYASPLVSFVSKRTAEASLVYFILWSFTPIGLPFWSLYATLPPIFFGVLGYLANLPIRL